ncbi:TIGR00341 family protein [Novipirellula artificiosorum]|uniref:TIGR00341 family protein n=1 Tax=Novipirellula artificiosorum TaxID=2528016 RepID=A0A5C6E0V5_9BACT|nr:TIGR00341 family protein [Novipirellula artificiosorum]TWU42490.1 hypothetical protein Poly41_07870 [Novipirellula artificiosorum]
MALRLIEIVIPSGSVDDLFDQCDDEHILDRWAQPIGDDTSLIRMLVNAEKTEALMDPLQDHFSSLQPFRVMLLPVEATLPRPKPVESTKRSNGEGNSPERIGREELYADIAESAELSRVFAAEVVIATLVAAVGLMRNDTAIIIGAMVIAPLLGPNMSLCLATTLGDWNLVFKSLRTNAVGLSIALVASLVVGVCFAIDPNGDAIRSRTEVGMGDIVLALASGCAGVLAFTTGAPSALVGVMVAVALLPPFAVFGLLLAVGEFDSAKGALLLTATNVICVNLAGVLTFLAQGVGPRTWWETERAKKATRLAILTWVVLLGILVVLIHLATDAP